MACSTCLLTSGFATNCTVKVPGGNDYVFYLIPRCEVTGFTDTYSNGVVDDITIDGGASWFQVTANKDSVVTTEDLTPPVNFFTQTIVFTISNIADDLDKEVGAQIATEFVNEIINNVGGILVLVKDRAGIWRIYGYENGLDVSISQKTSGAALADVAGATLTLTGGEPTQAPVVTAAFVATITI